MVGDKRLHAIEYKLLICNEKIYTVKVLGAVTGSVLGAVLGAIFRHMHQNTTDLYLRTYQNAWSKHHKKP